MAVKLLTPRDYLKIQEAAETLGVSEQTLRNWDKAGKLRAQRHPINGYRLYRISDLKALLENPQSSLALRESPQIELDLPLVKVPRERDTDDVKFRLPERLEPCHWKAEVALDHRHRPQLWSEPSSTIRRDWRKYPQEAHVLHPSGRAYRRFRVEEIAALQGLEPEVVRIDTLTNRQRIAAIGDAVSPPVARALMKAIDAEWSWLNKTALEICAGIGGMAEGAAAIGLEHLALIDDSPIAGALLRNRRPWRPDAVHVTDMRVFDFLKYRSKVGLLSGGPPCQPWSQSGQRLGRDDQRDLLAHLSNVVRDVQPEVFVFENVPGLATATNEPYLRHIVERLRNPGDGLSYGVLVGTLNAADFGVPQIRRRIFIVGLKDMPSAAAGHCFERAEKMVTHVDPTMLRAGRPRWKTVGETLAEFPDAGGWRRWIGVKA